MNRWTFKSNQCRPLYYLCPDLRRASPRKFYDSIASCWNMLVIPLLLKLQISNSKFTTTETIQVKQYKQYLRLRNLLNFMCNLHYFGASILAADNSLHQPLRVPNQTSIFHQNQMARL